MTSAWLGDTAVSAVSVTLGGRSGRSTTVRPVLRPLAPPEALVRLPERSVIVLTGAAQPLALRQARYFEQARFSVVPAPFALRRRAPAGFAPVAPTHDRPDPGPRPRRTPAPRPAGGVGRVAEETLRP